MTIEALDNAIAKHPFKPKGIKVGAELYRKLQQAGRITEKTALFGTVDLGLDFPVINENIVVWLDLAIGENDFILPLGLAQMWQQDRSGRG